MIATITVNETLATVLEAERAVRDRRPALAGSVAPKVTRAIEIALNAHRRGGATTEQIRELERLADAIGRADQ